MVVFKSAGYVDIDHDIFVGRSSQINKILQSNTDFAIYGGRRIGKSSLMNALERRLRKTHWQVAFVSADCVNITNENPDLYICRLLAEQLDFERPEDIAAFRQSLSHALTRRNIKIAILIDEIDPYIIRSEHDTGHTFPLIKCLRQLAQSPARNNIKIICGGFKVLYNKLRISPNDTYAFYNFAEDLPLTDLTSSEAFDLIKEGFTGILGIDLSEELKREIVQHATRHPAFLQHFCQRLQYLVSDRKKTGQTAEITKADVLRVYEECPTSKDAFINFVDGTLNSNLSRLARVVLLIHAAGMIGPNDDPATSVDLNEIETSMLDHCVEASVAPPSATDLSRTYDLLVMTGMLTLHGDRKHKRYRLSYPSYVKILQTLEATEIDRIRDLLKEYDNEERGRDFVA